MKRILLITLLALLLFNVGFSANNFTRYEDKTVIFVEKDMTNKIPRAPGVSNPIITVELFDNDYLNLSVQNFTGNVTVEITGVDGITTSFYCEGTAQEVIAVDALPAGSYMIKIVLQNKGTYRGYFDL